MISNIEKINDYYNEFKLHVYSKCGLLISFPEKIIKETNIKNIYMTEVFNTSKKYIKEFLLGLRFIGNKYYTGEFLTYRAIGPKKIKLICEKNDNINEDYTFYSSNMCTINKKLVDKVFKYKIGNKNLSNIFTDYFLKLYFESGPNMSWINNEHVILYPDLKKTFFNKSLIDEIKNSKKKRINNVSLNDIHFEGLIKIDNYEECKELYKQQKYNDVRSELYKSRYRSVMYLTNEDTEKMENVYNSIIDYFIQFGIIKENILIDLPVFYIVNKKWLWIIINVKIRDIYKGVYNTRPITQGVSIIKMEDLIEHMKLSDGPVHKILDNMYKLLVRTYTIKELKLNKQCKSDVPYLIISEDITFKFNYEYEYTNSTHDSKYTDVIDDDKLNKDIKILNVTINSNKLVSYKCGINVCCSINDKHYIISIVPSTYKYLYNRNNRGQTNDLIEEIIDNILSKKYNFEDYNDYLIAETVIVNMRYLINIISIDNYKCNQCNNQMSELHILNELLLYNKKQFIVKLKENYETSKILSKYCKEKFSVRFHIIVYNLIRNIISCYNKSKKKSHRKYFNFFNRILKLEESHNKTYNRKYYFFRLFLKDFKLKQFYTNEGDILIDTNENNWGGFVCVPGKEYIDMSSEYNLKYLIWYTTPNIFSYKDIDKTLIRIEKLFNDENYMKQIKCQNYRGLHDIPFDREYFAYIYNIHKKEDMDKIVNNYIYNISSLVEAKKEKIVLENFMEYLDLVFKNKNNIYREYNYHYPTLYMFHTLHIHVTFKGSLILSNSGTFQSTVNIGRSGNIKHEHTGNLAKDYSKFKPSYWKLGHNVYFIVRCNISLTNYIHNYKSDIYDIHDNIKKNIYMEHNINLLTDIMFKLMKDGEIYNVLNGFSDDVMKLYIGSLLKYKDNYKNFNNILYNFINYKKYYDDYSKTNSN